ncbi:hypothetical protein wScaTNS_06320 [Wolbachia pipientis]
MNVERNMPSFPKEFINITVNKAEQVMLIIVLHSNIVPIVNSFLPNKSSIILAFLLPSSFSLFTRDRLIEVNPISAPENKNDKINKKKIADNTEINNQSIKV